MNKQVKRLCICAMFSALIFVITAFVSLPAGPVGNINLGDAFIIIATFLLGPYGAIAGGLGAMLADLIRLTDAKFEYLLEDESYEAWDAVE